MGLGTELKEAREAQGLSLNTLQETTKIQKRYLQAIENSNFHILPGKFYARAFIKEYANAVGLDPNELMERYKDEIPKTEDDSTVQYTHIQRSRRDNNPQKSSAIFSVIPTVIVVILVIGIVFFAWYLYQQKLSGNTDPVNEPDESDEIIRNSGDNNTDDAAGGDGQEDGESDDEEVDDDTETAEPELKEPEFNLVEKGTGNSPESTIDFTYSEEEVQLTLVSTGRPWVDVKNEENKSFYGDFLTAEDSPLEIDLTGEEKIYFNVGDVSNLQISLNGVELEYPVDTEIVHQKLWINLNQESE